MEDDFELARLAALRAFAILDTPPEKDFDDLVQVAQLIAQTPMAVVSLVDAHRQWFKARSGIEACETDRQVAFCNYTIRAKELLEVPDATLDERFRNNPMVTGPAHIRYYCGAPLIVESGHAIGALCVIDTEPRKPMPIAQKEALCALARQVVSQMELRRAHAELSKRDRFVADLLDTVEVGIVACDAGGRITLFNGASRRWHGLDAEARPEEFSRNCSFFDADGEQMSIERLPLMRAFEEGEVHAQEMVIAPEGRPRVHVLAHGRALFTADGDLAGAVVALHDITDLRDRENALKVSEARFRQTFDDAVIGMLVEDEQDNIQQVNNAFCAMLGYSADEVIGTPLASLTHPDDRTRSAKRRELLRAGERTFGFEKRYRHRAGHYIWGRVSAGILPEADGKKGRRLIAQIADITEEREAREKLTQMALHDRLTGLANRVLLLDRMEHARALAAREKRANALIYCDLDRFKPVNDRYGHAVGDEVLTEVGRRLRKIMRPSDTVARLGGDEFVVLCEGLGRIEDVRFVMKRVQNAICEPYATSAGEVIIGVSLGATDVGEHASAEAALVDADQKMYSDKHAQPGRVLQFAKS